MELLSNEILIIIIKNVFEEKNPNWEMSEMFKISKRLYYFEKGIIDFEQLKKDYKRKIDKKFQRGNKVIKMIELGKIFRKKVFRKEYDKQMENWLFGKRYENIKIITKELLSEDNLRKYKGYILWKDLNIRILEDQDAKIIFENYEKIDQMEKYKIDKIEKIEKKEIKKKDQQYVVRIISGKIVKRKDKKRLYKRVNGIIGNSSYYQNE